MGSDDDPLAIVLRSISAQRMESYLAHCGGDLAASVALYQWNTEVTGALWETVGHLEVVLRNTINHRLGARHRRLGRAGSWLDDPAHELDRDALTDIVKARRRVVVKRKPASDGQTISELGFGFWRFLIAKRYTGLWPDLASGFRFAPDRARSTVERPVQRLHVFRNRLAHHERVWSEPLAARYQDVLTVLGYINPSLAIWVAGRSRVPKVLAACPTGRPHP